MRRPRTLRVLVDELAIEDGQIEPPSVGAVSAFPLLFTERPPSAPDVMSICADLEPCGAPLTMTTPQGQEQPMWSGLLRGDGWTASWRGSQPRAGRVELVGEFSGVLGIDAIGWVRGLVTRVRVVSVTSTFSETDSRGWGFPEPDLRDYREVKTSPRFFTDERPVTTVVTATDGTHEIIAPAPLVGRNYRVDIGVLIDLDPDIAGSGNDVAGRDDVAGPPTAHDDA